VGRLTDFAEMFEGAEAKSPRLAEHFRPVAGEYGCEFLDISESTVPSDLDGIHLDVSEHRKLGQAVAARAMEMLK